MSNDYINDKDLAAFRYLSTKEEKTEYAKNYYENNKEKVRIYQKNRRNTLRELSTGTSKFNFDKNSDKFTFRHSAFELKETPNNVKLPVGLKNKICRVKK